MIDSTMDILCVLQHTVNGSDYVVRLCIRSIPDTVLLFSLVVVLSWRYAISTILVFVSFWKCKFHAKRKKSEQKQSKAIKESLLLPNSQPTDQLVHRKRYKNEIKEVTHLNALMLFAQRCCFDLMWMWMCITRTRILFQTKPSLMLCYVFFFFFFFLLLLKSICLAPMCGVHTVDVHCCTLSHTHTLRRKSGKKRLK